MKWGLLLLALAQVALGQDDTTAVLRSSSQCNNKILRWNGVRGDRDRGQQPVHRFYEQNGKAKVVFPSEKLSVEPPPGQSRIQIPGCFVLHARDVHIYSDLKALSAQFEIRMGALPDSSLVVKDWPIPLPCQKNGINNTCPCGIPDSCMYCDFCKNLHKHIPTLESEKTEDIWRGNSGSDDSGSEEWGHKGHKNHVLDSKEKMGQCECDIQAGIYDIKAEVCTPPAEELSKILPTSVLALVEEHKNGTRQGSANVEAPDFTLYTVLTLYEDRFSLDRSDSEMARELVRRRKNAGLVGCHFILTDVKVVV